MTKTWSELYTQLASEAKKRKVFLAGSFELTARCNLQCKMCYVRHPANDKQAKEKELTTAQWIRIAEEAQDAGLLFLTLTGGEVFLREDFKILYEKFMNLGLLINIYTNGTLITPEIVNWLASMPPALVSITLYGASRETYQKVTGSADGYDRTVKAIDILIAKGLPTEVKTTVIQGNKADFDQLHNFVLERNIGLGVVNYISPSREGCNSDPCGNRLSPDELLNYEIHMTKRNEESREKNGSKNISKLEDAVSEVNPPQKDIKIPNENSDFAFRCQVGSCAGWLTWDGRLIPCGILDTPETYPLLTGFSKAWEELKQKLSLIPVCQECRNCQYNSLCERCPARLYRETGKYDEPAPYLCELARKRVEYNKVNRI
ncbi:radical SAM protein [Dehalobacter sp. CF]|jgi:Predicted Fe-S oxidoreductases|uniref:radical SAM protein n=1 Tax=Dehalobacter sp. CF TaxID=1131462 RepID=UPI00028B7614|nr:radical SAM protein [Dehalobacter sp. CF]AFV05122.1 Radical SAM domain protein [Dehalobacter sp. CF]